MAEVPRVSVVMAVRDGMPYLEQAMDSILAQTFAEYELVVVDDGSTDATPQVLARYQAADDRVRVHRQEAAGLTPSLNRGCALARGEYVARMDADDIAFPERLERQVRFLDRHPQVAMLGSAVVRIDERGRQIKLSRCPTTHAEIVRALAEYNCFTHPTVVLRRVALATVGAYREAYRQAQDYDLWLRLAERYELANLPEPLLYYRVYADQVSIRSLEDQLVSVAGAQAAARARAGNGRDPTPAAGRITRELLREWGVTDAQLAETMVRGYRYAAYVMEQAGHGARAIEVLRAGLRHASEGAGALKAQISGACWKQAKLACLSGRFGAGLSWALQAWRARPLPGLRQ